MTEPNIELTKADGTLTLTLTIEPLIALQLFTAGLADIEAGGDR